MVAFRDSLWPREAGAYAQLGVSLAAALALSPLHLRAWLQALATVCIFLASTPIRIRRMSTANPETRRAARNRLLTLFFIGFPCSGLAWQTPMEATPWTSLAAVLCPLLPATLLGVRFLQGREHSPLGEFLAVATFSLAAIPVAHLGHLPWKHVLLLGTTLTVIHGLGTALARSLLQANRRSTAARRPLFLAAGGVLIAGAGLILGMPWLLCVSILPVSLLAAIVYVKGSGPRRPFSDFRRLGWMLALSSLMGAISAVLGLSRA